MVRTHNRKSVAPLIPVPARQLYIVPTIIREDEEEQNGEEEGVHRTSYEEAETSQHYFSDQLHFKRAKWVKPWFAMMNMTVASIDVSCVSSFPETVANNGGLAFLVAYVISHVIIVMPYLYMEGIIGQYFQISFIGIWGICPLFKGVSVGAFVTCFLMAAFNPTVIVWAVYMMYEGWGAIRSSDLNWVTCNNLWNTCNCDDVIHQNMECLELPDHLSTNRTMNSPSTEYFLAVILKVWTTKWSDPDIITSVIDNGNVTLSYGFQSENGLGHFIVSSGLILTSIFIITLIIVEQSHTVSGYLYTFSTLFPIVVLVLLICRGMSLDGGPTGIATYMYPDFNKLLDRKVWVTAAQTAFFSMTAGVGIHIGAASYNPLHHDILKDIVGCIAIDSLTRLLATLGMFAFVGHLHTLKGEPLPTKYVGQFLQFPFTVFAEAVGHVSGAGFFAFLFYLMLIIIALDTCTVVIQAGIHSLYEEFRRKYPDQSVSETIFLFATMGFSFSMAVLTVTRGGVWVALFAFQYNYSFSFNMFPAIQVIVFSWIWGIENLCNAGRAIYGKPPHLLMRICWKFICPTALIGFMTIYIQSLYFEPMEELGERSTEGTIPFAIIATFLSVGIFVVYTLFTIIKGPKNARGLTAFMLLISPEYEHDEIRRNVWNAKRLHWKHYIFLRFPDEVNKSRLKDRMRGTVTQLGSKVSRAFSKKNRVHLEGENEEHGHHHHHHHHEPNDPRDHQSAWSLLSLEIPHEPNTGVHNPSQTQTQSI